MPVLVSGADDKRKRIAAVETMPAAESSPIRARFRCVSATADGLKTSIDHFLLRLPRRS
ncbi:MAG: hypothetical protein GY856_14530 [bacterium]|nr:hypothetical protein [bacterium]